MVDFSDPLNVVQYLFDKDYENKLCVDCKSPMPSFVSINNAILLCSTCAKMHEEFGYNISYIRETKDEWDNYLLAYLERGGNSRYIRFANEFRLTDLPLEEKLKTKIMEYYRLLVSKYIYYLF